MSQPPYPPQGGHDPGGEQPGQGWNQTGGANDPTQRFGQPGGGQRNQTRQFGQPDPYGAPDQAQYGQPQYGQQPYYTQPPYGQPYGQPPYGPPGPPWGPPGGPGGQPPKGNRTAVIALVVVGVVVLAAVAVALVLLGRSQLSTAGDTTSADATSAGVPGATVPPEGLGDDPALDEYARNCHDGEMQACDDLYLESPPLSAYEEYGDTCAGRQPQGTDAFCTDRFPGA
jgi:hypothetical protein